MTGKRALLDFIEQLIKLNAEFRAKGHSACSVNIDEAPARGNETIRSILTRPGQHFGPIDQVPPEGSCERNLKDTLWAIDARISVIDYRVNTEAVLKAWNLILDSSRWRAPSAKTASSKKLKPRPLDTGLLKRLAQALSALTTKESQIDFGEPVDDVESAVVRLIECNRKLRESKSNGLRMTAFKFERWARKRTWGHDVKQCPDLTWDTVEDVLQPSSHGEMIAALRGLGAAITTWTKSPLAPSVQRLFHRMLSTPLFKAMSLGLERGDELNNEKPRSDGDKWMFELTFRPLEERQLTDLLRLIRPPGTIPREVNWITVTEVAKRQCRIVGDLTLEKARARVSKACNAGLIVTNDCSGDDRRIDADSASSWLLLQHEKELDKCDA